jgi:hypothetical protein
MTLYAPQVEIIDLSFSFADGIAICALLNKLKEGCIDIEKLSPVRPQKENSQHRIFIKHEYFRIWTWITFTV